MWTSHRTAGNGSAQMDLLPAGPRQCLDERASRGDSRSMLAAQTERREVGVARGEGARTLAGECRARSTRAWKAQRKELWTLLNVGTHRTV